MPNASNPFGAAVVLRQLSKSYGEGKGRREVLKGPDLTVRHGELAVLLGRVEAVKPAHNWRIRAI